ncbi:MAG: DNA polymerase III subunit gamma/tau, partial [Clostridia bacterium]
IMDVVEIDAASNNGVDGVRELRDEAVYSPASVKFRVYIIDEVHMFSNSAFNALLKILEEPPAHVLFILATTELNKVPATILSRCQRFSFKRIPPNDIRDRLLFVARGEDVSLTPEAAELTARLADGGLRDALSIFDQCASLGQGTVTLETVESVSGLAGASALFELATAVGENDCTRALRALSEIYTGGRDLISVIGELSACLRDVLVSKIAGNTDVGRLNAAYEPTVFAALCELFSTKRLIYCIETIQSALSSIGASANKRIDADLCIIRLCSSPAPTVASSPQAGIGGAEISALTVRINALEAQLNKASFPKPTNKQIPTPSPVVKPVDKVDNSSFSKEHGPITTAAFSPPHVDIDWESVVAAAKSEISPGLVPLVRTLSLKWDGASLLLCSDSDLTCKMLNKREFIEVVAKHINAIYGISPHITVRPGSAPVSSNDNIDALCAQLEDIPNITIIP